MVSVRSLLFIFLPFQTLAFTPIALWHSSGIVLSNLNASTPQDGTDQQKETSKTDSQKKRKEKLDTPDDEYRRRRLDETDEDFYYWQNRLDDEDHDDEDYCRIAMREIRYDYDYFGEDYGYEDVRFDLDLEDCENNMDLGCGGMG